MKEYAKIQSVYKRDEKTHKFIEGNWSLPEFEYLKDNIWVWTEKVDGTNIRVMGHPERLHDLGSQGSHASVKFGGKTDNAQIPTFLLEKLQQTFTSEKKYCLPFSRVVTGTMPSADFSQTFRADCSSPQRFSVARDVPAQLERSPVVRH